MSKRFFVLASIAFGLGVASCKKSTPITPVTPPTTPTIPTTGTRAELTKDSIFLYAKEVYLWNDKLPTYEVFNPRKYTSGSTDLENYELELFDITKYSNPYEYKTGATDSKYSYIFDKANQNPTASIPTALASVDLEGNGNDLGIRFGLYGSETSYVIYVTAVYQNSPAEKLGFKRGDRFTKLNGVGYGTNYTSEVTALTNALNGTTLTVDGVKADGTSFTGTVITKGVFKSSPIYKTAILTSGTKKVGYLAYARFSSSANSVSELNTAFTKFVTEGVTDLIIDLRYNGGGYVSTAQHLINLIVPSSANSQTMFTEYFNATMQAGNAKILANQPLLDANDKVQYRNGKLVTYADVDYSVAGNTTKIAKTGSLGSIANVVFIGSGSTASASELVINSLKPYMNVKLVGRTTYGKPVGFFPITVQNKYDVYYSMFESKNAAGVGGYYDGLIPDVVVSEVPTGTVMYDFGDVRDNYLKNALSALEPGATFTSKTAVANKVSSLNAVSSSAQLNSDLGDKEFKGMIEDRVKIKQ